MAHWTYDKIFAYGLFARKFISGFGNEIDCADLALTSLVEFAYDNSLPVRLKYYASHGWKAFESASEPSKEAFKRLVTRQMGALNVIDNSHGVALSDARPGDLIMTRWDSRLGHTRIIYEIKATKSPRGAADYDVTWYQGNLPPVIPQKRQAIFSAIEHVFDGRPRRWNFSYFDG